MADGHILVIAPQLDMQRSLEFVLVAEGFEVTSQSQVDFSSPAATSRFDCIVLDHQALDGPRENMIDFCAKAAPVVLVSSQPIEWLSGAIKDLVIKPVMGGAVVSSVRRVMALRSSMPTK